jgi:hypothetical protein
MNFFLWGGVLVVRFLFRGRRHRVNCFAFAAIVNVKILLQMLLVESNGLVEGERIRSQLALGQVVDIRERLPGVLCFLGGHESSYGMEGIPLCPGDPRWLDTEKVAGRAITSHIGNGRFDRG